jgi:hypothetical protein
MSIIDMHIHLKDRSPCSVLSIEELYRTLSPRLNGICITDHWVLREIKGISFEEVKTFFGVELTSREGDILAYGIDIMPSKNLRATQVIDFIHRQGGVAVAAHPFSNRHLAFHDAVYDFDFDAIEINGAIGKTSNEKAIRAANKMSIPLIGGSDAHSKNQLNTVATKFENKTYLMSDIVKAIKEGNCKVIRI